MEHLEITDSRENATEQETAILAALVNTQTITQDEADVFSEIHNRLATSGLMP